MLISEVVVNLGAEALETHIDPAHVRRAWANRAAAYDGECTGIRFTRGEG